jgi:hypothetical protein
VSAKYTEAISRRSVALSQKIPGMKVNVTVALAESVILRASIKPITVPFKLWSAYELIQLTKRLTASNHQLA